MAFNTRMHERNIYKVRPDFANLALEYPEFRNHVYPDAKGKYHVDFTNTETLRVLTQILLKKDFNLSVQIPNGFLIPTVPQRLNYILWVEDLLSFTSQGSSDVHGIDIGTGPCAIFSLLGARKNNWKFVATESSDEAIKWANRNIQANNLQHNIEIVKVDKSCLLKKVLNAADKKFNFCLCNPPFFDSIEEIRKKNVRSKETIADVAKKDEIFAEGGEIAFIRSMIEDSLIYRKRVSLYTSMFGKKKSFLQICNELKNIPDIKVTTSEFCQGNTVRWGVAWTFEQSVEFPKVKKAKPKSNNKPKPPLVYHVPATIHNPDVIVPPILERVIAIMTELKIPVTIHRSSKNFAEIQITALTNTWSHQRRKRREMIRKCNQLTENEPTETKPTENVAVCSEMNSNTSESEEVQVDVQCNGNVTETNMLENKLKLRIEEFISNSEKGGEQICPENADVSVAASTVPLRSSRVMSKPLDSTLPHEIPNEASLTLESKCSTDESVQKSAFREEADEIQECLNLSQGLSKKGKHECSVSQHEEEGKNKKLCTLAKFESDDSKILVSNEAILIPKLESNEKETVKKAGMNKEHDEMQGLMSQKTLKKRKHESCSSQNVGERESKILCKDEKFDSDDLKALMKSETEVESKSKDDDSLTNVPEGCSALLDSILRVRKAKQHILLEMTCISNCRESMHQVFQLIKNKLK